MQNAHISTANKPIVFNGLAQVGGHAGLDFLNTVKYRGAPDPQDKLQSFADIVNWALLSKLISVEEASLLTITKKNTDQVFREVLALREQVRIVFGFPDEQSSKYLQAAKHLEKEIEALRPKSVITPDTGMLTQYITVKTAHDLKARIVWEIAKLLSKRPTLTIKVCDGDNCDWVFIDHTKAKRRRWCDTRTCGNTARVRRHRMKHKV